MFMKWQRFQVCYNLDIQTFEIIMTSLSNGTSIFYHKLNDPFSFLKTPRVIQTRMVHRKDGK